MENYTAAPDSGKVSGAERLRTYTNTQSRQILSLSGSQFIGVDTLHLTLSTTFAKLEPHFKAAISSIANTDGTYDQEPCILWTDTAGRRVYGNKAVINTENWQLTIVPCGNHANLLISTSAKAFAANNVDLMDADRLRHVIQSIQSELAERGLLCDLFNEAHVRRLDVARNADLLHGSNAYVGLFRGYAAHSRLRPASDGDTYFRLGASGWQSVIYDKGQEQAEKSAKRTRRLPPTNKLRGEIRFLTSREVAKRFDVKKLHPVALVKPERFDQLPEMYRETMRASMFESERAPRDGMTMNDETVKLWAQVQARIAEMAEPGSAEYYRLIHHAMLTGAGGLDGARRWYQENCAADDTEAAKRRRQRFNQELKRAGTLFGASETESSGLTRDELYNEMRDALLEE
jgi:hypothetical protein